MHRSTYGRRQRFQIHLDPLRVGGFLLLMLSSFAQAAAADPSQIAIEVSTNRDRYLPGEWVRATVTKCNPTPDPITVILNCPCCHDRLTVLGSDGATVAATGFGCIQVVVFVTWEPGECKAESYSWYQTAPSFQIGDQVAAGRYRLRHVWEFPSSTTTTTSEELTIDSGAAPQVGAFIDFETLPGGSPVPEGEVGSWYLSRNVRFHELGYGYRQPGFQNGDGSDGNFAQSNVTTYPSGFNIVAEYSVPVGLRRGGRHDRSRSRLRRHHDGVRRRRPAGRHGGIGKPGGLVEGPADPAEPGRNRPGRVVPVPAAGYGRHRQPGVRTASVGRGPDTRRARRRRARAPAAGTRLARASASAGELLRESRRAAPVDLGVGASGGGEELGGGLSFHAWPCRRGRTGTYPPHELARPDGRGRIVRMSWRERRWASCRAAGPYESQKQSRRST